MDPLEYFDEEYQNLNNSINQINSLFLQSKDNYANFTALQQDVFSLLDNKQLSVENINKALKLLEEFMHNCGDLLSTVESSYKIIHKIKNK
jgi:hypothetical protein